MSPLACVTARPGNFLSLVTLTQADLHAISKSSGPQIQSLAFELLDSAEPLNAKRVPSDDWQSARRSSDADRD
jgi:hypothetical protein